MSVSEKTRVHLIISGRVQGVFYRDSTRAKALELGVLGWVRNLPDGSVEAVAEAEPDILEQFLAWCHQGPRAARVDRIEAKRSAARGEFDNFVVTY